MINDDLKKKSANLKKTTETYTKPSYFDLIDIEESIKKNKFIEFTKEETFFYSSELKDSKSQWRKLNDKLNDETQSDLLIKIKNSKETTINFSDLNFENENGHKYHFLDRYYIIDIIGSGGFGLVMKCWCKIQKKKVAVKILNKSFYSSSTLNFFETERNFLTGMDHENIVKIISVEESENYLLLILELMEWCTLKQLIIERYKSKRAFCEEEVALIIKNILKGLSYIHLHNIMHRDIKPENIMFKTFNDLNSLKIIDFGLATQSEGQIKQYCGTLKFMSPEVLNDKYYNDSVDTWACGFILYILCSGGIHPLAKVAELSTSEYKQQMSTVLSEGNWKYTKCFPM